MDAGLNPRFGQGRPAETWSQHLRANPIAAAALVIAAVAMAAIVGAWIFQYGFGYRPCPLCLEQRYPYYFAIPLALMAAVGAVVGSQRKVLIAALAVIAVGMLWNVSLGAYHAGVEWKFWPGPQECSGSAATPAAGTSILEQIHTITVVRCDEAAWRFLGLSLAGYNVLISIALAAVALCGVVAGLRRPADTD